MGLLDKLRRTSSSKENKEAATDTPEVAMGHEVANPEQAPVVPKEATTELKKPEDSTATTALGERDGSPREMHPKFREALNEHFPGTQREDWFMDIVAQELDNHGFKDENTIACIGVCRDEICGSLMDELKSRFGDLFIFRGLAGFIMAGRTGFGAAHAHSPQTEHGREKYLYVVGPHIGISSNGELGKCDRRGRAHASSACGALAAFHGMLEKGSVDTHLRLDDIEMSVINQLLLNNIKWGELPDLAQLTKLAAKVIVTSQLESIIKDTVDTSKADYAVIAGVQIHGPGLNNNYFMPMHEFCYAVCKGNKKMLNIQEGRPRKAKPPSSLHHVRSDLLKYIPAAGPCASFNEHDHEDEKEEKK